MQLVIRNACVRNTNGLRDIAVEDGKVASVSAKVSESGDQEIDAKGRLVAPSFANLHYHLDKCLTGEWVRSATDADAGSIQMIPRATAIKKKFTPEDIEKRASSGVSLSASYGTTALRAFADVDTTGGLMAVRSLLKVKKAFKSLVDLQVVAFPQEGLIRDEGAEELLRKALDEGADIVGGIPWYEHTAEDARRHIDIVFEIARAYDKDIHMLVDDTDDPNATNIEYLLAKTLRERRIGRVAASHCRGALASSNDSYARKVVSLAKEADFTVVENPQLSLIMYGRLGGFPQRRGMTRVKEFVQAGVNVAIGQDDMDDPYYPFGRGDMLELASFMCHGAQMGSAPEIDAVFDMITCNAYKGMGLSPHGPEVGKAADLVVLDAQSVLEAIRMQAECRYVIKGGRLIAENQVHRSLHTGQS